MTTIGIIIIMFILGFIAPRHAIKFRKKITKRLKPIEKKAAKPKAIGHVLKWPIKSSRKAAEKSLDAGKKARDKAPF